MDTSKSSLKWVPKQQLEEIEFSDGVTPVETVCRVCLVKHLKLFTVTSNLQNVYETITREEYNKVGYPVCMCYICLAELRKCHRFVETARESNRLLERWSHQQHEITVVHPFRTYTTTGVKLVSMGNEEVSVHRGIKLEAEDSERKNIKPNPDTDDKDEDIRNNDNREGQQEAKCLLADQALETSDRNTTNSDLSKNIFSSNTVPCSQSLKTEEPTLSKIEIEINTGTNNSTNRCSVCCLKCDTENALARHMQFHDTSRPHVCDVCQYRFDHSIHLKKHKAMHKFDDANEYSCDRCEFKTLDKHDFTKHMIAHTDAKPLSCDICDYKCKEKRRLADHMRSHTGERPFLCEMCSQKFTLKTSLEQHVKSVHTDEKPFSCNSCNYRASRKDHLRRHMRTHTGEKPFSCHLCDYTFSHKGNIKQHLRARHKMIT